MKDDIQGYLYKRKVIESDGKKKQVRLRPGDPTEGKFYIQWDIGGRRFVKCLCTSDITVARQRWAELKANLFYQSDEEKYLQRLIASKEEDIRRLQKLKSTAASCPVAEAFDKFLASKYRKRSTSERTIAGYRQQFARFSKWCVPPIRFMRDITPLECERYIDDLEHQEKPRLNADTIDKHIGLLEMVWKVLMPDDRNPWTGLHSTMKHSQVGYRRLTLSECRTLYDKAPGEYKTLILLGFSTGQRLGDCATLNWSQVNVLDSVVGFRPAKTRARKDKLVLVPMIPQLARILRSGGEGDVFRGIAARYRSDASAISKDLAALFADSKIGDTDQGRASFHSLRHTFASMLDESGCPLQIRAYLTNHALPGQSELMPGVTAIYSHPDIDPIRAWMKKVIPKL